MNIDELIEKIIKDKIQEIQEEYNVILLNHSNDLEHINICTMKLNSMKRVLEEILQDLEQLRKRDD